LVSGSSQWCQPVNNPVVKIKTPLATLGISDELKVETTCLTWVNTNRIALGHSDGSITLWSLDPQLMLARQLVHYTSIIDISSGYPSKPYHIASTPVGGYTTLVDLSSPSYEITIYPAMAVNTQPNLLQWNDHLQGWLSLLPSAQPFNAKIGFAHLRCFPQFRTIIAPESLPTCLAAGRQHPFLLVGFVDGSVWTLNPMRKLFAKQKDPGFKMKVLQHEYVPRPITASEDSSTGSGHGTNGATELLRGASIIVSGRKMTPNVPLQSVIAKRMALKQVRDMKRKGKKGKPRRADFDVDSADEARGIRDPARAVLHEPLTRITVMTWNPNPDFSCWAAVAMGSGLVRVMDLGLEQ
jgi:transcription factor C subunit 6